MNISAVTVFVNKTFGKPSCKLNVFGRVSCCRINYDRILPSYETLQTKLVAGEVTRGLSVTGRGVTFWAVAG